MATELPRKASLALGIVIWYLAGLTKSGAVRLNLSEMPTYGIPRSSAAQGLKELEAAKLVSVDGHNGRVAIVTLLNAPDDEEDPYAELA